MFLVVGYDLFFLLLLFFLLFLESEWFLPRVTLLLQFLDIHLFLLCLPSDQAVVLRLADDYAHLFGFELVVD